MKCLFTVTEYTQPSAYNYTKCYMEWRLW